MTDDGGDSSLPKRQLPASRAAPVAKTPSGHQHKAVLSVGTFEVQQYRVHFPATRGSAKPVGTTEQRELGAKERWKKHREGVWEAGRCR